MNKCTEEKNSKRVNRTEIDQSITIMSKGSRPLSLTEWAQSNYDPVPLKLTLTPVTELLTDENLSPNVEYGIPEGLNAAALRYLLEEGQLKYYCTNVLGFSQEECDYKSTGCGVNDDCGPNQYCLNNPKMENGFDSFSSSVFSLGIWVGMCCTFGSVMFCWL